MLEKDKYLKKINFFIIFFLIFFSFELLAENEILKLIDYNQSLKNSSVLILQTSEGDISEGTIFFGEERIRVDYSSPNKITIIMSEKKGAYINHTLQETQFFNTRKNQKTDIFVDYRRFAKDIKKGDRVLLDDGKILLRALSTNNINRTKLKVVLGVNYGQTKG